MFNRKALAIIVGVVLSAADGLSTSVFAGDLRVRCETRGTRRSKISVDGNNVASGNYTVQVASGANTASANVATVGDEFEADFDSNPADIRAGATAISRTFIQGGTINVTVTGPENLSATGVVCRRR